MIALYVVAIYWGIPFVVSVLFMGWLLFLSHDLKFEGYVWLWRFIPVFRFRLISRKSWYARAWEGLYGQAMWMSIIHKDAPGALDDESVENVIVHEMRHVVVGMVLGIFQWVTYGLDYVRLWTFTDRHPYRDNIHEIDAREAVHRWVKAGRPRTFNFGRRR